MQYVYTVKQQLMEFFIQELVDHHKTASSIYFVVFHYNFDFFRQAIQIFRNFLGF